ncbi:hypothetical protein J2T13_000714 [Paenibacillus sp. DS2015]|uniref:ATP-grasp domain-containing protein n=1 Tax=Paenibacillus sp. DS2015 TaxID=3373917 RepID=UPI003D21739A
MTVLILNNLPASIYEYNEWLSNSEKLLITSKESADGFRKEDFKEIIGFENYTVNGNVELKAIELYEKYKYEYIVATGEFDLLRAGKLRDMFGISGQTWESALAFRDKTVMKEYAKKGGIKVPAYKKIQDSLDIIIFIKEHGYPVVVKPVDGAGATDTTALYNENDLQLFLSKGTGSKLEIEKFIEGNMYHIDGIILNNELAFIWPSRFINNCLSFKSNSLVGGQILDRNESLFNRLLNFVKSLINSLPTPQNTAFHAEVFHTFDDELVLCEIASRIAGASINEVILHAFNINLRQIMVQAQSNIFENKNISEISKINEPIEYTGWLIIPPKQGTLLNLPTEKPPQWVKEYKCHGQVGKTYEDINNIVECIASFVVSGNSADIVSERILEAADWIDKSLIWE